MGIGYLIRFAGIFQSLANRLEFLLEMRKMALGFLKVLNRLFNAVTSSADPGFRGRHDGRVV